MCGFIAQLVEHRTSNAEVIGSNPVEARIFFLAYITIIFASKIAFITAIQTKYAVRVSG